MIEYDKLIRNKIPEIIENSGEKNQKSAAALKSGCALKG